MASRAREASAAPEITAHDCAIESIWHSSFDAEPSGVPSSKNARRYHSPPPAPAPRPAAIAPASLRHRAAPTGDRADCAAVGEEKPADPDALAASLAPDAIHAVVPVARPDQREAV